MASPNDMAFVVGIDDYGANSLPSCVNDANEIARLLANNEDGSDNFTVQRLVRSSGSPPLTRVGFLSELTTALRAVPEYDFLFYFSGHGATSDWGSELILSEFHAVNLFELMHLVYRSPARHVTIILDWCFSGSFGVMPILGGNQTRFDPEFSLIRDNVTLLAASTSSQTAAPRSVYSAFTGRLIDGLSGAAADSSGNVTASGLFGFAAPSFTPPGQRPVMKASVSITEPQRSRQPPPHRRRRQHQHLDEPTEFRPGERKRRRSAMATYVLVPGGWHGGWWFEPLAQQLRSAGTERTL